MSFLQKVRAYEVRALPERVEDWKPFKTKEDRVVAFAKLVKDKRKVLIKELGDGISLYQLPDKFFVLNDKKGEVTYYVQFGYKNIFGKKSVTQFKLWRSAESTLLDGLSKEVFFKYLLPTADMITTDKQQTQAGEYFWFRRIGEAFAKGYHVYGLNLNTKERVHFKEMDDFTSKIEVFWGEEYKHQAMKVAISKTALWNE